VDFYTIVGYVSGLYLIKPDLEPSTLLRTVSLVHVVDAVLCWFIAAYTGRNKKIWTAAGLFLGMWALGTLFFVPDRRAKTNQHTG
jgi:hypothetical protein